MITISKRLTMIASLVTDGFSVCDVGCDHGYTSIYLVQKGVCPRALAMDLRKGPLAIARENVLEHNMEDTVTLRLSDGLSEYCAGETESILISGMGGPLICDILEAYPEKARAAKELILSPQSELSEFRERMKAAGFILTATRICHDEGKFYFGYRYIPSDNGSETFSEATVGDAFTPYPLETYIQYLEHEKEEKEKIIERLSGTAERVVSRKAELLEEIRRIQYEINSLRGREGV